MEGEVRLLDEDILDQVYAEGGHAGASNPGARPAWTAAASQWLALARASGRTHIPRERLAEVCAALAACAGDGDATTALRDDMFPAVRKGLSAAGVPRQDHDDILQSMWARLFLPHDDGPARVLRYLGHGDLAGLMQVTAVRIGLTHRRGRAPAPLAEQEFAIADPHDTERAVFEQTYGRELKDAFEDAVATLGADDRLLLRMHIIEGLSIDKLAVVLGVHRATAARRTARARAAVAEHVRDRLAAKLGDAVQMQSILRVVRSGLDLSLSRVLAS